MTGRSILETKRSFSDVHELEPVRIIKIINPHAEPAFKKLKYKEQTHHAVKTFLSKHYPKYDIAGDEYMEWAYKNPHKAPTELKDGKYFFFLNSKTENLGFSPCIFWVSEEEEFARAYCPPTTHWSREFRAVLVEKQSD